MKFLEIKFTNITSQQTEILLALLANIGFEGFEEFENQLVAYINEIDFKKESFDAIINQQNINYTTKIVEQQNWNAQWENSFDPVIINNFAAIRASFHLPVKNVQHQIIITPKMSFGTGHHATTYLMISQMNAINFTNKTVVDFGTGTGVLAILAEKMGAASVTAIDNDDWSIDNAKENIATNNSTKIKIEKGEIVSAGKKFDIILANINLNVILQNMPSIALSCNNGALILLSGFLVTDETVIKKSLIQNNLVFTSTKQKNDWICIKATK